MCVDGWGGGVGDEKEIESGAVWTCVGGGGGGYGCGVVMVKEYDEIVKVILVPIVCQ